jgi:hypothetical protein
MVVKMGGKRQQRDLGGPGAREAHEAGEGSDAGGGTGGVIMRVTQYYVQ